MRFGKRGLNLAANAAVTAATKVSSVLCSQMLSGLNIQSPTKFKIKRWIWEKKIKAAIVNLMVFTPYLLVFTLNNVEHSTSCIKWLTLKWAKVLEQLVFLLLICFFCSLLQLLVVLGGVFLKYPLQQLVLMYFSENWQTKHFCTRLKSFCCYHHELYRK